MFQQNHMNDICQVVCDATNNWAIEMSVAGIHPNCLLFSRETNVVNKFIW